MSYFIGQTPYCQCTLFLIFIITSHVIMPILVYITWWEVIFLGQEICIWKMLTHVAILSSGKIVSIYTFSDRFNLWLKQLASLLTNPHFKLKKGTANKNLDKHYITCLHTTQGVRIRNKGMPSLFTKFLSDKYINSSFSLFFKTKRQCSRLKKDQPFLVLL